MFVDGDPTTTSTFPSASSPQMLPQELVADGSDGDVVVVRVTNAESGREIRTAQTAIVGGKKLLMRVGLEARCAVNNGSAPPPTCYAPFTCVAGDCASRTVSTSTLVPWTADWASATKPGCGSGGAADVTLADGQTDQPLADGASLNIEHGLQGGVHIQLGAIATNVPRASRANVKLFVPDNQVALSADIPFAFVGDGKRCLISGFRLNPDGAANPAHTSVGEFALHGHAADVTLTVREPDGTTHERVHHVSIK